MTSCRISLELTNTGVGATRMWSREEEQEQFVESQKVLTLADLRYKREEKAKARVTPKIKLK